MSADKLNALQPAMDSKPASQGAVALGGMDESQTQRIPEELSILPVRGFVLFPGTVMPLNVQRAASLKLLDDTLPRTKVIGLVTQRDETKEDPSPQDLYSIGTAALVLKLLRQSEDHVLVVVQGLRRFSLRKIIATDPFLRAEIDLPQSILPPTEQGMGSHVPEFARLGCALVRADARRAGTGAFDDHEHRESRTARRFSGAEPER